MAETQLELVHKETDQGNYEQALKLLEEARRLVVSTDDPELLIREGIARGNICYSLGRIGEAETAWNSALAEAELAGEAELAAIVRLYQARGMLLTDGATADAVKTQVHAALSRIKTDRLSIALGWLLLGLAEKEQRRWAEAEAAMRNALAIHEKDNYLEQTAYDWFLIASVRSVAGQYAAALEALEKAIGFDRRAENSYGLGTDYRAQGDVYTKQGKPAEAEAAYRRSAAIFRAIFREPEAKTVEARLLR
ncbi:MAG: tetratricopeptide repeat protein [Treponema sp.]|nr:tetratricopeptide repeat protein [Treponema sp.]